MNVERTKDLKLHPQQNRRVGFDCFWPSGCSDSARCNAHGSCVAAAQALDACTKKATKNRGESEASAPTYRRIIQIATTRVENTSSTQCHWIVYALCNDGTLWEKPGDYVWGLVDTTEITTRRIPR